ncbi:MAG: hypothetical protein OXT68_14940 [Chloroflexota bacterium]|nr:hypothetical protein [Chloroflexota bacterium]MDE2952047.1 hypothetical protein [Chloroflexota bacterium]
MEEPTKELQVPASIYERAEAIAGDSGRSAETLMLDALSLHFCELSAMGSEPEALQTLADEQLWALVHRRLTPKQDARLRDLLDLGNQGRIHSQDEGELAQLAAMVDQQMVLRSKALVLLQRRGHDIDQYFESAV